MRPLAIYLIVTVSQGLVLSDENLTAISLPPETLQLHARQREWSKTGHVTVLEKTLTWEPQKTALIICDMWDSNSCYSAVELSKEMAPRMNQVTRKARELGVLIIHAPSSVMDFYSGTPQRARAREAPNADNYPPALDSWCHVVKGRDSHYPIEVDGCNCTPRCQLEGRITRQMQALEIGEMDVISDSGREMWNLFEQRGIDNVVMMGVHANMCVLGRPFGIRNLVTAGKNVVLVRDLTDSIYNPDCRPYVSHFTGTDLIVEHIERNWCPTITSTDLTGTPPFRFAADTRPRIVMVIAKDEHDADRTLPALAREHLGKHFKVTLVSGNLQDRKDTPGLTALKTADLAIVFASSHQLSSDQLAQLHRFVDTGKPVLAILPTSQGVIAGNAPLSRRKTDRPWLDRDLLGIEYLEDFRNSNSSDDTFAYIRKAPEAQRHPVLKDWPAEKLRMNRALYRFSMSSENIAILLRATIADSHREQPVAWTHVSAAGGRIFCTSLSHANDFDVPVVRRLFVRAIYWLLNRDVLAFEGE